VMVAFPVLVGALALADRGPALRLGAPWAVYGGRISYFLYLVHIPIFEVYWFAMSRIGFLAHGRPAYVIALIVLVAPFAVAAVGYRWVEEPTRRRLRKLPEWLAARRRPPDSRACVAASADRPSD